MRYYIAGPFQYQTASGTLRHHDPRHEPHGVIFDTTDPFWDVPADFIPPVMGLKPMDEEAQTSLATARKGIAGRQLDGIGVLAEIEPLYHPGPGNARVPLWPTT